MNKLLILLTVLTTVIGCGNKNPFAGRERVNAPRGAGDTGVLVERAQESEIADLLTAYPNAQVRILNRDHGLYEIFGIPQETVAAKVSGPTHKNKFFELIRQPTNPSVGMLSVPAPAGLQVDGLNPCQAAEPGPTAILTIQQPAVALHGATIQLGEKIRLNTLLSQAAVGHPSQLKSAVVLVTPQSSAAGNRVINQSELEFTPDALGVHQIVIVVQDSRNVCALDGVRFLVTANRPYNGPSTRNINVNLAQMKHLAAVQAQQSWELSQGEGVTIAIIDTGVNYNHPTLASNIALNAREIPGNGIDDDNNGFKDDVLGVDFVNGDEFPYDDEGHGSHVAGLAASSQFGLAKRAKILAIKALTGIGGDVGTISAALRYAVDRGAKVVNMSLGAPSTMPHPALVSAMTYAESKGVLVVVSAGNGDPQTGLGYSIDEIPYFPARLTHNNVLAVAACDANNVLAPYSNFGKVSIDITAPGGNMPSDPMFSASHENPRNALFVGMSGTSMATPVVAGIAAQVISLQPSISASDLKGLLLLAGEMKNELLPITVSGRHISALKALELASNRNVLF